MDTQHFKNLQAVDPLQAAKDLEQYAITECGHVPYTRVAPRDGLPGMTEEEARAWLVALGFYNEWSRDVSPGRGIPNKGFGNVMDTFPEIAQLGFIKFVDEGTEGISLIVAGGLDVFGHMAEGVTYMVRTSRNALH